MVQLDRLRYYYYCKFFYYQEEAEEYGIDWDEVVPLADPETVEVPLTQNPLSAEQYTLLCQSFDPTDMSSDCDAADIYCAVRQYVHSVISE